MSEQEMVQCQLESPSPDGISKLTSWVPFQHGLQVGTQITLKDSDDPERRWTVMGMSTGHPRSDIKRGWNNNI